MKTLLPILTFLLIVIPMDALGQGTSSGVPFRLDLTKPLNVAADRVSFDNKVRQVRWTGKVVAVQDKIEISADEIIIHFGKEKGASSGASTLMGDTGSIKSIVAAGHVIIIQEDRRATCERVIFDQEQDTVTLEGNPRIFSDRDQLSGSRIVVHIRQERVEVEGSSQERVRVTVLPRDTQSLMSPQAKERLRNLKENPPAKEEPQKEEPREEEGEPPLRGERPLRVEKKSSGSFPWDEPTP